MTGDLLSFLRCGLQYRYHNGSSLPPSRPVQLWFGEFIHGVMETAYRTWRDTVPVPPFPWPCNPTTLRASPLGGRLAHDIGTIGDIIEGSLRAKGKNPRNNDTRDSAYNRAESAVNVIGPQLFPLISSAEEKVIGTRIIPPFPQTAIPIRATLYELHGVIDVLTNVQFNGAAQTNIIKQAIQRSIPNLSGDFEVIIDYKGTRRDGLLYPLWTQYEWQIQTYAWLRMQLANSLPVIAGVILYINELSPGEEDLVKLKKEIQSNDTDVAPPNGSQDYYLLNAWQRGNAIPSFSLDFLIARSIRVIPVNLTSQDSATLQFDNVVAQIENCANSENLVGTILPNWAGGGDANTCVACDFRHFCPSPAPRTGQYTVTAPTAP